MFLPLFRYYEDLKEENSRYPGQAPFPWLEAQFKQLGLDVYRLGYSTQPVCVGTLQKFIFKSITIKILKSTLYFG